MSVLSPSVFRSVPNSDHYRLSRYNATYSNSNYYNAHNIVPSSVGLYWDTDSTNWWTPLIGTFQFYSLVYNFLLFQFDRTALHYAALCPDPQLAWTTLTQAGVNPTCKDKFGKMAKFYMDNPSSIKLARSPWEKEPGRYTSANQGEISRYSFYSAEDQT